MRCSSSSGAGARTARSLEPRRDQLVIVVARRDHELPSRQRLTDVLEERLRAGERLVWRAMAKLEHVPEQQQPVDALELSQQRLAHRRPAQQIDAGEAAEM